MPNAIHLSVHLPFKFFSGILYLFILLSMAVISSNVILVLVKIIVFIFQHAFSKSAICGFLKIKYRHVRIGQYN